MERRRSPKADDPGSSPGGSTMKDYWVSSLKMTVGVQCDDAYRIISAAPIVRKFIGQPIQNLINWMDRQGGLIVKELGVPDAHHNGNIEKRTDT